MILCGYVDNHNILSQMLILNFSNRQIGSKIERVVKKVYRYLEKNLNNCTGTTEKQ